MIKEFLNDEQGAELAEYAVAVALVVAIAVVAYQTLGTAINNKLNQVAGEIEPAPPPPPPPPPAP